MILLGRCPYKAMHSLRTICLLFLGLALLGCKPEKPTAKAVKERAVSPAEAAKVRAEAYKSGISGLNEEQLNTVLAQGDGVRVTLADMMKVVNQMPMEVRQRYQSPERWPELLQELVAFQILLREADKDGLKRDPTVLHTFKSSVADRYLQEKANLNIQPSDISESMVADAYAKRPELSTNEKLVHAFIFSSDNQESSEKALKALKEVEGDTALLSYRLPEQITALGDPDLGVGASGDAGFINSEGQGLKEGSPVQMVPQSFAVELFKVTAPGQLVGPSHTDRGYMFGFIKSIRGTEKQSLEEVSGSIRNQLLQEKRKEYREATKQKILQEAGVKIDTKALSEAFPEKAKPKLETPRVKLPKNRMRPLNLKHMDADKRRKMLESTIEDELGKSE